MVELFQMMKPIYKWRNSLTNSKTKFQIQGKGILDVTGITLALWRESSPPKGRVVFTCKQHRDMSASLSRPCLFPKTETDFHGWWLQCRSTNKNNNSSYNIHPTKRGKQIHFIFRQDWFTSVILCYHCLVKGCYRKKSEEEEREKNNPQ